MDKENQSPNKQTTQSVPEVKFDQARGDLEDDFDETLQDQLQQALDDKAELIEESILDKERIKEQRETIELLTKRIREFEMSRAGPATLSLPVRSRSSTNLLKQLGDDNMQMARELDRLIADRDRLERKLIDLKIKYANGFLATRRNSAAASTDEEESENVFSTLSIDEKLRKRRTLKPGSSSMFRWFKKRPSKPNEVTH